MNTSGSALGSCAAHQRGWALLLLLAFGCTTVRPPVSPPDDWVQVGRVALAEPELELWMEGAGPIDPGESSRALAQSRDALAQALAGRGLDASEPDDLLVIHARAIARTDERKSAQTWTYIGIVFAVVAIVVVAIVGSKNRGGPPRAVQPVRPVGPMRPGPWAPAYLPRRYVPPPPFGVGFGFGLGVSVPLNAAPVPWVSPTEQWLASRGWFDGDAMELTVELTDPQSGAVRWHRTLRDGVDPRDPAAVTRLVDRVLAGLPFGQRTGGAPSLDDLPPPPPAPGEEGPVAPPEPPAPNGVSQPGSESPGRPETR